MTQDEILEMVREAGGSDVGGPGWTTWVGTQSTEFLERFANLVAAKEREALAQTQEPFGYFKAEPFGWTDCSETDEGAKALYEAPPQRTWVGLTRNEQSFIYSNLHNATSREDSFWVDFANAIEAKLKERQT